jgi:hypothetical protein
MLKRTIFFILVLLTGISSGLCKAQDKISTEGLLQRDRNGNNRMGQLHIYQDARIDTLISRHVLSNMKQDGLDGFRIQIYNSSDRNAKVESGKMEAEFIARFPGLKSYATFERPGYYKIRAGDYRTKTEGTKDLLMIRRVWPDAYLVPDKINFPDLD